MQKRFKVAIVSAVWKRPDVFEYFAKGIHALTSRQDMDFVVIIAGSEGAASMNMVASHGFTYIEIPNDPLSEKHNSTIMTAGQMGVDYVLCLGSDDVISPGLMDVYKEYMEAGIDYIGVTDFYFYDIRTGKASYWGGYRDSRKGHTAGAGRLISRKLMSAWRWRPFEVKHSKVLDNSMQGKLKLTPHSEAVFSLKEKGVFALDIKSETNMTPFELWDNTSYIDPLIIKNNFPYLFKNESAS